jgi:hypothetical protein
MFRLSLISLVSVAVLLVAIVAIPASEPTLVTLTASNVIEVRGGDAAQQTCYVDGVLSCPILRLQGWMMTCDNIQCELMPIPNPFPIPNQVFFCPTGSLHEEQNALSYRVAVDTAATGSRERMRIGIVYCHKDYNCNILNACIFINGRHYCSSEDKFLIEEYEMRQEWAASHTGVACNETNSDAGSSDQGNP